MSASYIHTRKKRGGRRARIEEGARKYGSKVREWPFFFASFEVLGTQAEEDEERKCDRGEG